jgi:hypothetical protein
VTIYGKSSKHRSVIHFWEPQTFNPSVKIEGDLETYFRVFTDPLASCHDPALRPMQVGNIPRQTSKVYIDGRSKIIDEELRSGSGIWYGHHDQRNTHLRTRPIGVSKHHGIIVAAIWALSEEPPFSELIIHTKSKFLIEGILVNLKKWETTGYIDIDYKDLFRALAAKLRSRGGPTKFLHIDKASGDAGSLNAQNLAQQGTEKDLVDEPDLTIDPRFNLTGAQLSLITQKLAYAGICNHKRAEWRRGTSQILDITRHAAHRNFGPMHDDKEIWLTIKNKDFNKPFRTFLWKALHKNHKIGTYWLHIDNFEHRSKCHKCDALEDLEHIMLECDIPGRETIWNNTKHLWLKKHDIWPEHKNIGDILSCGLAEFKNEHKKPLHGANRLYRILISEAAHLIWKLRNERLFKYQSEDEWPQLPEIHNRWLAIINAKLTLDRSATHNKYGKRALKHNVVLDTWSKTLKNEQNLPKDWILTPGVLVDVAISEHPEVPPIPDEPP